MPKDTLTVEMTEEDIEYIVGSFWNNYGHGLPDPRTYPHDELMNYIPPGSTKEEKKEFISSLCKEWDERYARLKVWKRRLRRLRKKNNPCFGSPDSNNAECKDCYLLDECLKDGEKDDE